MSQRRFFSKKVLRCDKRGTRYVRVKGHHTRAEWEELKAYYGNRCLNPNCPDPTAPLTRDHVVPLSLGGSNHIVNIQCLCGHCNSRKGSNIIDYRLSFDEYSKVR